MMSTILDTEAVSPLLLWPDVESESAISVVIQLAQLLLAFRPFTLDRKLVLPGSPGVAFDLFPPMVPALRPSPLQTTLDVLLGGSTLTLSGHSFTNLRPR